MLQGTTKYLHSLAEPSANFLQMCQKWRGWLRETLKISSKYALLSTLIFAILISCSARFQLSRVSLKVSITTGLWSYSIEFLSGMRWLNYECTPKTPWGLWKRVLRRLESFCVSFDGSLAPNSPQLSFHARQMLAWGGRGIPPLIYHVQIMM